MAKVCVNAKNLPQGATLTEGKEYEFEWEGKNLTGEDVVYLVGEVNEGTTAMGFPWRGYKRSRFRDTEKVYEKEVEFNYAMN